MVKWRERKNDKILAINFPPKNSNTFPRMTFFFPKNKIVLFMVDFDNMGIILYLLKLVAYYLRIKLK